MHSGRSFLLSGISGMDLWLAKNTLLLHSTNRICREGRAQEEARFWQPVCGRVGDPWRGEGVDRFNIFSGMNLLALELK
jgi:hypothetical protein